jgi:leucine dehydrogenase
MLTIASSALTLLSRTEGDHSVFVAMETGPASAPANGGLRLLPYPSDPAAVADAFALCQHMRVKHRYYGTGFRGAKVVARGDTDDKASVLHTVSDLLRELGGALYTGCDLNTTRADMAWLQRSAPYVLAGLGSAVDPSRATGEGVTASLFAALSVLEPAGFAVPQRFLVHGCGATGSVVARELRNAGAHVLTFDRNAERAEIPGCENVSDAPDWASVPHDVLVPCSVSRLVDAAVAERLTARLIVGSANDPITEAAERILRGREIVWVPDPVSNAGAVIADSVEHYAPEAWVTARPEEVYDFVREAIGDGTRRLMRQARHARLALPELVQRMAADPVFAAPCGRAFAGGTVSSRLAS